MMETPDLLRELADTIDDNIRREAEQHFYNSVFVPDFKGQTPEEKYRKHWAFDSACLSQMARGRADEIEYEECQ